MPTRLRLAALRPEDLLVLDFEFINLQPGAAGILERQTPGEPSFVVVHFPPQYIAEAVFDNFTEPVIQTPVRTVMTGGSRLIFRLPEETSQLPLTLNGLLNWDEWEPVVASGAPGELETAIEFPWRLILSPDGTAHWHHPVEQVTINGNFQLWHTDLVHGNPTQPGGDLRALAYIPGASPFSSSLNEDDRKNLVAQTLPTGQEMAPIQAESFSLSTLGASARLRGEWPSSSLEKYEHFAAQGRDQFIITVHVGFLCGTGHRAVIVTRTERTPITTGVVGEAPGGGALFGTAAYLYQTWEVQVEQPNIDYGPMALAYSFDGREMPIRSITLVTRSAPILGSAGMAINDPMWLRTPDGQPLLFKAAAVDMVGNQIGFQLPLMFVPLEKIDDIDLIRNTYNHPPFDPQMATHVDLGGQLLAMADPGTNPGSTQVKAQTIEFGLAIAGDPPSAFGLDASQLPPSYHPRYLPYITSATAALPALDELLGNMGPQEISHDPFYLQAGFNTGSNPGQTFVRLKNPLTIDFPSQKGGGLAQPNSAAKALSRTLGAVSAPDALQAGKIDLSAFSSAKFLGTVPLLDIIKLDPSLTLPFDPASAAAAPPTQAQLDDPNFHLSQPRLITRRLDGADQGVETRFVWKPPLRDHTLGILTLQLAQADLFLGAITTRSPSGKASSMVIGRLRGAGLSFKGTIGVMLGELSFRAEEGRKMEVGAKNVTLIFDGPLKFVNSLRSILPESGFDDPPFLTVDGQGVIAGYTLGLPTVGVGVFSLQNIALSAALSVPFIDKPAGVRFGISERHKPFLVTVSLFGGGGFFALAVSARGLEQIEASIEFGGNIALNLVIASGGVYVMAGIYFSLTADSVTLTGYLRCGGYLEVLGLISVSVEFYLAFTFRDKDPGGSEVCGQASLKVCVKIAFLSKSVSLSMERRFAGSDGDPSFSETMSLIEWAEYMQAFA